MFCLSIISFLAIFVDPTHGSFLEHHSNSSQEALSLYDPLSSRMYSQSSLFRPLLPNGYDMFIDNNGSECDCRRDDFHFLVGFTSYLREKHQSGQCLFQRRKCGFKVQMCVDDTSCIYSHLVELKSRDVYLKVGDELNLHCDGTGIKTPRMAIKNQFGQTVGGPSKGHATYKKPAAERNDAGRYSCVAMTDNQLTEEVIKKFEIEVHVTSVGRVPLIVCTLAVLSLVYSHLCLGLVESGTTKEPNI